MILIEEKLAMSESCGKSKIIFKLLRDILNGSHSLRLEVAFLVLTKRPKKISYMFIYLYENLKIWVLH